jgi:hypothetical protein
MSTEILLALGQIAALLGHRHPIRGLYNQRKTKRLIRHGTVSHLAGTLKLSSLLPSRIEAFGRRARFWDGFELFIATCRDLPCCRTPRLGSGPPGECTAGLAGPSSSAWQTLRAVGRRVTGGYRRCWGLRAEGLSAIPHSQHGRQGGRQLQRHSMHATLQ